MFVAKNCLVKIKENFDIDDIKQVITEDVYPNLYKLLQVAFLFIFFNAVNEKLAKNHNETRTIFKLINIEYRKRYN